MTPEQRRDRGQRVARLLSDEDFKAACDDIIAALKDAVVTTTPLETERREALFFEYRGLFAVLKRLQTWRDDGAMAEQEIARKG